jgi:uncharacterized membrane protein YphA (DoxX/SURF4 family)
LQRWYTKFPRGLPALGLFVLRVAIGARLLIEGLDCWLVSHTLHFGTSALGALAIGAGGCFMLGLLTPLVAGVSALAEMALYLWHPACAAPLSDFPSFEIISVAIAVALLGPGAISLDAYFFGRRKIVIARGGRS